MPIGVIQKEANPMNHFTSLGPKQSDQAMEPLGCDILNSEIDDLRSGKNDSDRITPPIRFPN